MRDRKKIVLVNIVRKSDALGNYPPLSTACLKAYAEQDESIRNNCDISLYTAACDTFDPDTLFREIKGKAPAVIGLSCYLWNLKLYLDALPEIRRIAADALIVAGGPEAHPGLLDVSRELDGVAIGEGETLFQEMLTRLLNGKPWQDTKGIAYRRGRGVHLNSPQKLLDSLDEIPSPFKTGILPSTPVRHIEYSRGCAYRCSYCVDAAVPLRHMSIQRIEEEIIDCIDSGSRIGLTIGSYLNHKDFGTQVLRLVKKYQDMGHDISIEGILFVDANNDNEEFFNLLDAVVPCKSKLTLSAGVQCTHPETLKLNRRVTRIETIRNIFTKHDFFCCAQLIIGLPGDNIFRVAHTLAECVALAPQFLQTLPLMVIPNTYLFENKTKMKIESDAMPPHGLYSIYDQSEEDLRKTNLMAGSCSMEYNCRSTYRERF